MLAARCALTLSLGRAAAPHASRGLNPLHHTDGFPRSCRFAHSASLHSSPQSNSSCSSYTTSNNSRNEKEGRDGSTPDAATLLLLNTLASVPQFGFTRHACLHASSPGEQAAKHLRIVSTLFPGPESAFDSALFAAWNKVADLAVLYDVSPDHVVHLLKAGSHPSRAVREEERAHKPVRMQKGLGPAEEKIALQNVAQILEQRLRLSWAVRNHLTHGITALSTTSPTSSTLHSIFPHPTLLPNLPNPIPLLTLTSNWVNTILSHPTTQARTGWLDPDGPDWYAVRTRFTLAYTAATLHAASQSVSHFQDTQSLLHSILSARDTGLAATLEHVMASAGDWIQWGARGWLGVLRSRGF